MVESISDLVSIVVVAVLFLRGVYFLYEISVKNREHTMQRIASVYYKYYENTDDDNDFDDQDEVYFEE